MEEKFEGITPGWLSFAPLESIYIIPNLMYCICINLENWMHQNNERYSNSLHIVTELPENQNYFIFPSKNNLHIYGS